MSNFHQLNIDWDFTIETKSKYFNPVIDSNGITCISLSLKPFYEINATGNTFLFVSETISNAPLFLENIQNPFIYIRNIGICTIDLCASSSPGYFNFNQCKIEKITESCGLNYKINPKEGLFLYFKTTQDGTYYSSVMCQPFGFNYNFSNIKEINPNGQFPVLLSGGITCYSYESGLNIDVGFKNCGYSPYYYEFDSSNVSRTFSSPITGCEYSLVFNQSGYLRYPKCFEADSLGITPPASDITFQTWFKIDNEIPQSGIILANIQGAALQGYNYFPLLCLTSNSGIAATCVFEFRTTGNDFCIGEWNHYALTIKNCCAYMYLNGNKKIGPVDIAQSGCLPFINYGSIQFNYLSGSGSCNHSFDNYSSFVGCLSNIKYIRYFSEYTGENTIEIPQFGWGQIGPYSNYRFLLSTKDDNNLENFCYKSFSFNNLVDDCACLSIYAFNSGLSFTSEYGSNYSSGELKINKIIKYENDAEIVSDTFNYLITGDLKICILYDIDFKKNNFKTYFYQQNGVFEDSSPVIKINEIEYQNITVRNSGYCFRANFEDDVKVYLNIANDYSIECLRFYNIDCFSLFMPVKSDFCENYSFKLACADYLFQTGLVGCLTNEINYYPEFFYNYSNIVNCNSSEFQNYKSEMFYLNLDYCENRVNTNTILEKNKDAESDFFIPYYGTEECSFSFSGLEFRYSPLNCILYKESLYEIPDSCIALDFFVNSNCLSVCFPLKAISENGLRLSSETEIIDYISNAALYLNYEKFNFQRNFSDINYQCFGFPKIGPYKESPEVNLKLTSRIKIQENLCFYLDPYLNFKDDIRYQINNLLFLVASHLNSGIASTCSYSGFEYGTSDYNFLFLELKDEFYSCCFLKPTGYLLFDEKISITDHQYETPLSFKATGFYGYNFILPVNTNFVFYNSGIDLNQNLFCGNVISDSRSINYISTGYAINSSSTGYCEYTDSSGCYCCCTGYLNTSKLNLDKNKIDLFFSKSDIANSVNSLYVSLCKQYIFTGVQPFIICSNYPLVDLYPNIYTQQFCLYQNKIESEMSGIYYFTYDLSKQPNTVNFKIKSAEGTNIDSIVWEDASNEKLINYLNENVCYGQIQGNAGLIKYDICNMLGSNNYYYCNTLFKNIKVNVIGEI